MQGSEERRRTNPPPPKFFRAAFPDLEWVNAPFFSVLGGYKNCRDFFILYFPLVQLSSGTLLPSTFPSHEHIISPIVLNSRFENQSIFVTHPPAAGTSIIFSSISPLSFTIFSLSYLPIPRFDSSITISYGGHWHETIFYHTFRTFIHSHPHNTSSTLSR